MNKPLSIFGIILVIILFLTGTIFILKWSSDPENWYAGDSNYVEEVIHDYENQIKHHENQIRILRDKITAFRKNNKETIHEN